MVHLREVVGVMKSLFCAASSSLCFPLQRQLPRCLTERERIVKDGMENRLGGAG